MILVVVLLFLILAALSPRLARGFLRTLLLLVLLVVGGLVWLDSSAGRGAVDRYYAAHVAPGHPLAPWEKDLWGKR
jgi:hypothetical protein